MGRSSTGRSAPDGAPAVTVAIPSNNNRRFVTEAIDSVLGQTLSDIELLIIDDGSTDGSPDAIRRHLDDRSPSIPVTFEARAENLGSHRTLSQALEQASGEYFAILDSDDLWDPRMLERQVPLLRDAGPGFGASFSDAWVIDEVGVRHDRLARHGGYRGGDLYRDFVRLRFFPLPSASVFRRSVLQDVGGFSPRYRILYDWNVWLRIATGHRLVYVPEPLTSYRVHGGNTSLRYPVEFFEDARALYRDLLLRDPSLLPLREKIEGRIEARFAAHLYNLLKMGPARRAALVALRKSPTERLAWTVLLRSLAGKELVRRVRDERRARRERTLAAARPLVLRRVSAPGPGDGRADQEVPENGGTRQGPDERLATFGPRMNAAPKVSVAIPSFNHAGYVEEAIDSVLGQTYRHLELLIIDDGSTDGSPEAITRFLDARNPEVPVRLVTRENRGQAHTLNQALRMATGEYLATLDSDDAWEPAKLEKQVATMEAAADDVAACFSDCWITDGRGRRFDRLGRPVNFRSGNIYEDLVRLRYFPLAQAALFRRRAVLEAGGYDERLKVIPDWDLWLRLAKDRTFLYTPEPLASYRIHGTNMSYDQVARFFDEARLIFEELFTRDPDLRPLQRRIRARIEARHAGQLYNMVRLREARRAARHALALAPIDRLAWTVLLRSLLGSRLVGRLRGIRQNRRLQSLGLAADPKSVSR